MVTLPPHQYPEGAGASDFGANGEVPDIFLSHSGKQKPFVEHLFNALLSANHTAFFDKHTLPKGSQFSDHINRAAKGCKLGVIVLSEDFLISKWPMMELEMLVLNRGHDPKVLPLCYKLSFSELKNPTNISRWRFMWKEKGGQSADRWEEALKKLAHTSGEVFQQGTSETAYIMNVVRHICAIVPCHVPYDMSLIQGHQRLAQVIPLMKDHAKRYDMFLAIDNVCESSREEVERLLSVGFSATTKILLTSRSEQVLKDLLVKHTKTSFIGPLPAPDHEEAVQIFKETSNLDYFSYALMERIEIPTLLERCRFNGVYHALALKALARHVKGVGMFSDLEGAKRQLCLISNADLRSVDKVIRLNYENLPQQEKHMFLDIVVFVVMQFTLPSKLSIDGTRYAEAHWWLCILYNEFHEDNITMRMKDLALGGLIQIEVGNVGASGETIRVHDLFLELARKEVAGSPRFFLSASTSRSAEAMEWERLERVILRGNEKQPFFFDKLQQRQAQCGKLQVLDAADITIRSGIHLAAMASLAVLVLQRVTLVSAETHRSFRGILKRGAEPPPSPGGMLKLDGLAQLQILWIESCSFVERITGLEALRKLQTLHIQGCPCLKKLEGLSGLFQLEVLYVDSCENLKEFSGSACNIGSRRWPLRAENESIGNVRFLSRRLKHVSVQRCGALERIPDVSGLASLESLELGRNRAMEEVGGEYLSSTLKVLTIAHCDKLRKFPSLDKCVHLETLRAGPPIVLKDSLLCGKLPNLHTLVLEDYYVWSSDLFNEQWSQVPLLQDFRLYRCASLQNLEMGCLTNLRSLRVGNCEALEEIGDVSGLLSLEELRVGYCPRLKRVSGLVGISTHLKHLWLQTCGSLEESALPDAS